MKVLISAAWLGGAGGAERALHSMLTALDQDDVDVVVTHQLGGSLAEVGERVRVFSRTGARWRGATRTAGPIGILLRLIVNPVRRRFSRKYDVYLEMFAGRSVGSTVRAELRLLNPSGGFVQPERAQSFDYVALESPDNLQLLGAMNIRYTLMPPPYLPLCEVAKPPRVQLPRDFYLTVFNPYGAVKGAGDLADALDKAPNPIVWCHSARTQTFAIPSALQSHANLIHVEDPTPAELRFMYENCLAYLSFSRGEGFGWAIADALRFSSAVVSRKVGVLTYPQVTEFSGIHLVGKDWTTDWSALPTKVVAVHRNLDFIDAVQFRRAIVALLYPEDP